MLWWIHISSSKTVVNLLTPSRNQHSSVYLELCMENVWLFFFSFFFALPRWKMIDSTWLSRSKIIAWDCWIKNAVICMLCHCNTYGTPSTIHGRIIRFCWINDYTSNIFLPTRWYSNQIHSFQWSFRRVLIRTYDTIFLKMLDAATFSIK